ncbi:MAG: aminotransferase class IV [Casimicrobium sp.]
MQSESQKPAFKNCAFVNGQFTGIENASINILDWGFLHSDATYDVVTVWDGAFFRLDDHLDRFFAGLTKLRMTIPYSREEVTAILHEMVARSGLREAYVEFLCTRGLPQPGSRDPRTCTNRFYAFAIPYVYIASPEKQKTGLHAHLSTIPRIHSASVDPTVKNYHWLDMVMGLFNAYDRGAETVLMDDGAGNVTEGPGFNVFVVKGRTIATPISGVLEGITRKTAMELIEAAGLELQVRKVARAEFFASDEVFITSSGGGIMAITKLDDQLVGTGVPGPVTQQLQTSYWLMHQMKKHIQIIDYKQY